MSRFGLLGALLFGHREEKSRFLDRFAQLVVTGKLRADPVLFAQRGLRRFGPLPKIRPGGLFLELGQACGLGGDVKDASRALRSGPRGRVIVRAFPPRSSAGSPELSLHSILRQIRRYRNLPHRHHHDQAFFLNRASSLVRASAAAGGVRSARFEGAK